MANIFEEQIIRRSFYVHSRKRQRSSKNTGSDNDCHVLMRKGMKNGNIGELFHYFLSANADSVCEQFHEKNHEGDTFLQLGWSILSSVADLYNTDGMLKCKKDLLRLELFILRGEYIRGDDREDCYDDRQERLEKSFPESYDLLDLDWQPPSTDSLAWQFIQMWC